MCVPHRPMPSKINSETMPILIKELWSPSLDIAASGITYIMECFETALRVKALSSSIKPYGI